MKKFKYLLLLIPLLFISTVSALSFDSFDVTWYYRNKGNESNLLNITKNQDQRLYASTSEYVNGYTTRIESNFIKDVQYYITYELKLLFSPEQELNYRSDTLDRIINYSYVDDDFKLLNVTATEDWNRSASSGPTLLTIKVVMQIIALNNTSAVRFGVYTTNNISIGFYNHTEQIDYYLLDNIVLDEDINSTIIDKNNQILSGQEDLKNDISNSTNTITGEIQDMEQSIIDSNKETQDVIKDQFNSCRESVNLFSGFSNLGGTSYENGTLTIPSWLVAKSNYIEVNKLTYFLSFVSSQNNSRWYIEEYDENYNQLRSNVYYGSTSFNIGSDTKYILIVFNLGNANVVNYPVTISEIQLEEGSVATNYEPYGEEICSNKIDETNNQLGDLNNSLNNSNTSSATNDASNFFSNFTTDTFGLTSIITAPLSLINSITSASCSTLRLPLPYLENEYLELPCMDTIYTEYFGSFFNIYQTITFGIVAYWVIVRIFNQVKDFKNPDHDEIEVLDL